jgi:hypothetical protein
LLLPRRHKNTNLLRSSGRRLGTWQQSSSLTAIGRLWRRVMFPRLLISCIQSPVSNSYILS